jgi:hypothetical protein
VIVVGKHAGNGLLEIETLPEDQRSQLSGRNREFRAREA